ncbi:hypothetical protein DY000_02006009 [Brassica cretica]|uniref:Uncharacterized protein n=1 Tax=Brassica cretica TaxID=69181 RepID=A0ABQ7CHS8_BRACR|nr:hypothetical protein DY000_02006009 [Brassica cretica]
MVARLVNVCVDVVDVVRRVVDGDLMVVCVDVVDVVGRVVDEDFMVSGSVDVVDVTGGVADGALGDGYESGKRDGEDIGSSDSNGGAVGLCGSGKDMAMLT